MSPGSAFAIYALFWMLTLFAVLPWGVRTGAEVGHEPVAGAADSAPANPMIWRKLAWTTAIATTLFALFYVNYVQGWLTLDDIPGWG